MKLTNITINNFKGIVSGSFDPTSFACLVGENNAGKSTVLQAVVYALNRPSQLAPELFYDIQIPISLGLEFSGITGADIARLAEEHRAKIEPIVNDGVFKMRVVYAAGQKVEILTGRRVPIDQRLQPVEIAGMLAGKKGAAIRTALAGAFPEFAAELPEALATQSAAKEFLAGKIALLPPEAFQDAESALPSGISSSITALLPEPIYIPAVKNLSDDLKTTQSTSFGRLLGLLLEDLTPDLADIHKSLEQLNTMLNRTLAGGEPVDNRHQKVRDLETTVESFLSENFPKAKVELNIPRPELRTILNTAQIFVDDGSRDLIDNKGDGIKRSLTFALLQTYVAHMAKPKLVDPENPEEVAPRPLIFLFEEPELYLHPRSQRILFGNLARISATHQVLVTTHSPLFFAPGVTAAFIRVAKTEAQPKPVGVLYPVNLTLDANSAEVFRLAKFENTDAAFFSRRVVLFEGESDDAFCKHVAKATLDDWDFDNKNIALVRVSGKGNFAKFRRFFEAFGIEVKIVADLDALFEGHQHLIAQGDFTAARQAALVGIDARIAELGTKAEPSTRQIKDRVGKDSYQVRYQAAKTAVEHIRNGNAPTADSIKALDDLFVWEADIARVKVCRTDDVARGHLVPLLDLMRQHGVCVLSRGAIEDYYPANTPGGAKPDRALAACALVTDEVSTQGLCTPLGPGRPNELSEIFAEIFRGV